MNLQRSLVTSAVFVGLLWAKTLTVLAAGFGPGHFSQLPECTSAMENTAARPSDEGARANCKKKWTVLVYMAADNNLEPYALKDLNEMMSRQASSHRELDVLVHFEKRGGSVVRKRVFNGRTQDLGVPRARTQVGTPVEELYDFLEWGIRAFPSQQIMVVLWGHGQGWGAGNLPSAGARPSTGLNIGVPTGGRFGGLAFSDTSGASLSIPALSQVLHSISYYVLDGKKIDLYVADACLMQMVEVALELAPWADYIVGSADVQEYVGLPYAKILERLQNRQNAAQVAAAMPQDFLAGVHARKASMSAIATQELQQFLVPALHSFGFAMAEYLQERGTVSQDRLIARTMEMEWAAQESPKIPGGATEVGAWMSLTQILLNEEFRVLGGETQAQRKLKNATVEVKAALHRTAISYALGTEFTGETGQFQLLGFKALSIWVPSQPAEYLARKRDFLPSKLFANGQSGWAKGLAALYD